MIDILILGLLLQIPKPEQPLPRPAPAPAAVSPGYKRVTHYIVGQGKTEVARGDVLVVRAITMPTTPPFDEAEVKIDLSEPGIIHGVSHFTAVDKDSKQQSHIFMFIVTGMKGQECDIKFVLSSKKGFDVVASEDAYKIVVTEDKDHR